MQRVYGYEGAGIGQYSFTDRWLTLPLPGYMKHKEEWDMNTNKSLTRTAPIVCELLSAGFRIDTNNGDKLTKADLARSLICSTR